jgi:hypothetical protein
VCRVSCVVCRVVGAGRGVVVVVVVVVVVNIAAGSLYVVSGCIGCIGCSGFSWRRLVVRRFGQSCCQKM